MVFLEDRNGMVFSCLDWRITDDTFLSRDHRYMKHALAIAEKYKFHGASNPCVGCVVVRDDCIISVGVTAEGGRPHAEAIALKKAGKQAKGSDVYVTLEPCAHEGKTPPCANALIEAGVSRVIVGTLDPDFRVSGRGVSTLKEAGIEVCVGVMEQSARYLHRGFLSRMEKRRPWVTLKVATSMDGKIALKNGESKWITDEVARDHARYQRASYDAILTGIGTVLHDNPRLNVRNDPILDKGRIRVVLDRMGRLPTSSHLYQSASNMHPLWVFHGEGYDISHLKKEGVMCFSCPYDHHSLERDSASLLDVEYVLEMLGEKGVNQVFVEGGQGILSSFLKGDLVDQILWYRASSIMGEKDTIPSFDMPLDLLDNRKKFSFDKHVALSGKTILEVYHRLSLF